MSAEPSSPRRALAVAAAVALVVMFATRVVTPGHWYSQSAPYRAQVDALLAGRTALARAPEGVALDLAWTPHGTEQVWGLAVPAWEAPFEIVGRAIGLAPFPDRVPLFVWLTLMIFALVRAWRPAPDEPRGGQLGAVLLSALLPGVLTMMRTRFEVYEECALYAYGAAMFLLVGIVALVRQPRRALYWLVLAGAGITGFVRPTVWFYGAATAVVASVIWIRHVGVRRAIGTVAIGAALFVAGGAALYTSNAARFGAGTEFGHRLNVHTATGNLVATHFSYPFERVGLGAAAAELAGSLVDRPELGKHGFFFTRHRSWGEAPVVRSREYYFTTFTWTYVPFVLAGLVLGALAWRRTRAAAMPRDPLARWLWLWAIVGGAPLVAFYLRAPCMSSRYQLDLAPAIVALLVIAWRGMAAWLGERGPPHLASAICVVGWASIVATAHVDPHEAPRAIDREAAALAAGALSRPTAFERAMPAAYDLDDPTLAAHVDRGADFHHCRDALGERIDCAAEPLAGDTEVTGTRTDRTWTLATRTIDDEPPAPLTCTFADADDDDASAAIAPTCSLPPTIATTDRATLALAAPPPTFYLDGWGWNPVTGHTAAAVITYVSDARYVELELEPVNATVEATPTWPGWDNAVRVRIGATRLPLAARASTPSGVRLRYAPPPGAELAGVQVMFLAIGRDDDLDLDETGIAIRRMRWRDDATTR